MSRKPKYLGASKPSIAINLPVFYNPMQSECKTNMFSEKVNIKSNRKFEKSPYKMYSESGAVKWT